MMEVVGWVIWWELGWSCNRGWWLVSRSGSCDGRRLSCWCCVSGGSCNDRATTPSWSMSSLLLLLRWCVGDTRDVTQAPSSSSLRVPMAVTNRVSWWKAARASFALSEALLKSVAVVVVVGYVSDDEDALCLLCCCCCWCCCKCCCLWWGGAAISVLRSSDSGVKRVR